MYLSIYEDSFGSNILRVCSCTLSIPTPRAIILILFWLWIPNIHRLLQIAGFFLKATLWPDFTELFFRFFGVKKGEFYLTSAKKASGFWRFLNVKNGDF